MNVARRSDFQFPAGSSVLHVGPHKTGTTSLQRAFHAGRNAAAGQGVHYAGPHSQPMDEVLAMLARENPQEPSGAPDTDKAWRQLVKEVQAHSGERILVSSEFLADARPDAMRVAIDDLGNGRPHVLVTLRSLPRIMPSQWQQYVQNGLKTGYGRWLRAMLRDADETTLTPSFWWRHRHDLLVRRWSDAVGADRVVVVVVDETDRDQLLRDAEGLFALREGTLATPEAENRSLTWAEIELVRHFNRQFAAADLPPSVYHHAMRFGAVRYLQQRQPAPTEARLTTPVWAAEAAAEMGASMATSIAASGVRVIGDLDQLAAMPTSGLHTKGHRSPVRLTPEVGATALMGLVHASALPEVVGQGRIPDAMVGARRVPTSGFLRAFWRRTWDRLRGARHAGAARDA